jgi:hypothetical protein
MGFEAKKKDGEDYETRDRRPRNGVEQEADFVIRDGQTWPCITSFSHSLVT